MRSRCVITLSAIVVLVHTGVGYAQTVPGPLSASSTAAACAPAIVMVEDTLVPLRIVGAQDPVPRTLFGPSDLIVVTGGTQAGVQLGQDYYIRRTYRFGQHSSEMLRTVHTTGWLRIIAVNETTAIGQIQSACDAVLAGDYLQPYTPPTAPVEAQTAVNPSTLDFSSLGRVIFGDEERRLGSAGDFMLIRRGNADVAPGTRVAVYRDLLTPGVPLAAVGEGVIVSIENGIPLMRITAARDAVMSGDYIVPRR
jgi:hypothetical protein